ncbi:hypothetical protein C1645_841082 [Glomus cerebriforme]|uniref:Uncharacterized protein n=1 Tax=Glomus cerebriforme TaxID=658196 RepID=A0A397RYF7_9GLOM|nr:hypothetical protein C1645_841082 [Glomus cerebriforme]
MPGNPQRKEVETEIQQLKTTLTTLQAKKQTLQTNLTTLENQINNLSNLSESEQAKAIKQIKKELENVIKEHNIPEKPEEKNDKPNSPTDNPPENPIPLPTPQPISDLSNSTAEDFRQDLNIIADYLMNCNKHNEANPANPHYQTDKTKYAEGLNHIKEIET